MYVCMYVCMYVYACMHVCMYVCFYIYFIYIYIYITKKNSSCFATSLPHTHTHLIPRSSRAYRLQQKAVTRYFECSALPFRPRALRPYGGGHGLVFCALLRMPPLCL